MKTVDMRLFSRNLLLVPLLAMVAVLFLSACAGRVTVKKFSELKPGEVLLVGKIEMVPPLKEKEQIIGVHTVRDDARLVNQFFARTSLKWELPDGATSYRKNMGPADQLALMNPTGGDYAFSWYFGQTFFAPLPGKSFYITKAYLIQKLTSGTASSRYGPGTAGLNVYAWFPGGMKVNLKPGDKAVYIGTLRYHRDVNMDVRKIKVIDEYKQANTVYRDRFPGNRVPLKKRIMVPSKRQKLKF